MRLFGSDKMSVMMQKLGLKEGDDIQHPWISKAVEGAQKKVEGMNFDIRKQLIDFDNVMNKQREAVYRLRNEILEGEDITDTIKDMINESIEEKLSTWTAEKYAEEWDWISIDAWLSRIFGVKYEIENKDEINFFSKEALQTDICERVIEAYEKRKEELTPELMAQIQRMVFLQMIDSSWHDNLYELDQLRRGIGFRAYAQKDPKVEYQRESFALFESMMKRIRENTVEYIFKVQVDVKPQPLNNAETAKVSPSFGKKNDRKEDKVKTQNLSKIGRNDSCPCGSGKKYKKCCGV
ncbi:MAG: SEC-C domain-containing protein [Endomicrobium sp.]|uniref:SEC-C metal-binding domain-containing protein n=1 Tax=Candidatus Endomicrobiellum pyrsonymphae TaxID=1408203 RepID=UPI003576D596|nr:SEC-C domain-containing protein [Endomicrobium sp.]